MTDLPNGWTKTELGNIVRKKSEKVLPGEMPDIPFIGMDSIAPNSLVPHTVYAFRDLKSSGNKFSMDDVLYGRMRPYLNKVCRVRFSGACSGEFIVMESRHCLSPDYLALILHHRHFVKFANEKTSGDRPRVTFEEISIYPICLPPLAEQGRIVARIEELFSSLDKGIENLKTAQVQLKTYRQAVLKWAFEGRLTNENVPEGELPTGWTWGKLGAIIEKPKYGTSKKCEYEPVGTGVLRIPNIGNGFIDDSDLKFSRFDDYELQDLQLKAGDILTIRSNGSVDLVGKCALISQREENYLYAGYLIRLRPKAGSVEPKYLLYVMSSKEIRIQIEGKAKSTSGVNNINSEELKSLTIPLPPTLDEQARVVAEIDARLSVCDKLEESITQSLTQAEALRQSILKKAFEGKLVPQDPNDEPASELLARIHAAAESPVGASLSSPARRGRKKKS